MPYNPQLHHRRSIRLPGYDYSQAGAYFVTLITHGQSDLFGEVIQNAMHLNKAGKIAAAEWQHLATRFANLSLDTYIIMPNHLHGILMISESRTFLAPLPITTPSRSDLGKEESWQKKSR